MLVRTGKKKKGKGASGLNNELAGEGGVRQEERKKKGWELTGRARKKKSAHL